MGGRSSEVNLQRVIPILSFRFRGITILDSRVEKSKKLATAHFSIGDILVIMALVSICAACEPALRSIGPSEDHVPRMAIFTSMLVWLGWLVRLTIQERDSVAISLAITASLVSLILYGPAIMYAWHLSIPTRGEDLVYMFRLLVSVVGIGVCIMLGILYLVRKRMIVGSLSLLNGLWPIAYLFLASI